MADETIERVVAEAALAKRFETRVNERASKADIPALVGAVEDSQPAPGTDPGEPSPSPIALDTDGVPYITIGDE